MSGETILASIFSSIVGPIVGHTYKHKLDQLPKADNEPEPKEGGYYKEYPLQEVLKCMGNATEEIMILQTWISPWNCFCQEFDRAIKEAESRAASRFKIRMILLDPACHFSGDRGLHSGFKTREASEKSGAEAIEKFTAWKTAHGYSNDRFELRLSRELPTFTIFCADDRVFFTPYLRHRTSLRSPALEFSFKKDQFASDLKLHFEGLWKSLEPS